MFLKKSQRKSASQNRESKLQSALADLKADILERDRTIKIQSAEIGNLSAVIARDRERVKAEAAGYARSRAEHEGLQT